MNRGRDLIAAFATVDTVRAWARCAVGSISALQSRCTPSPRLRGEGRGERAPPTMRCAENPPHPLASLATSPRKRGEVELAARAVAVSGFAECRSEERRVG